VKSAKRRKVTAVTKIEEKTKRVKIIEEPEKQRGTIFRKTPPRKQEAIEPLGKK